MGRDLLGEFELLVLLALMQLDEADAYALSVVDVIERQTQRRVARSAVYTTVKRMERKGLVSTYLGEPRAERGGKARRHIRVEAAGIDAVRTSRAALERMWAPLDPSLESN